MSGRPFSGPTDRFDRVALKGEDACGVDGHRMTIMQLLMLLGGLLILAGSFIVAWFTGVRRAYLLVLSSSFLVLALAFLLTFFLGSFRSRGLLLSANGLFIVAQILFAEGLLQRRGKTFGIAFNVTAFVTLFGLYCLFEIYGTAFQRTIVINAGLVVLMALAMLRFWIRRDDTIHDKLIFWTIIALGVMHCLRTFGMLFTGIIVDPNSIFWQATQIYILMIAMILTIEILASHFVESLDRLNTLRDRDQLTGVLNREGFERALAGFYAERSAALVALTLLDLDKFKITNDTLGHPAGDAVLRAFGEILLKETRATDVVGRIGGDEFAIFSVGLDRQGACAMAERIRIHLAHRHFPDVAEHLETTCSIGVATARSERGYEVLYRMADNALYGAKRLGRNRVVADSAPSAVEPGAVSRVGV
ncbi:GGDEF domain-containing protein [Martelella lutilitoris]|uniref:diguanylate cyclase n=1 Tax=Martelella lutilitoris TaxID=2583532 RepID=A0A5C4JP63_9HYPH|nr:GGDEF domain-containing protein [Martelella lutilitoris]TNB47070.1 GGDEF domain-containing protein [Martelella lutilitoris]